MTAAACVSKALTLLGCFAFFQGATAATRDEMAAKPPMGFNSYYMHGPYINEALIKGMADYLYTNKLNELGYKFVVIDEGWTYPAGDPNRRDATGAIVPDPSRFPDLGGLIEYIHSRGLLAGIYTQDTFATAAGYTGSGGHLEQDAATFARWGVDFVKFDVYDGINYLKPLEDFASALDSTGRPMVLYTGINGYANKGADARVLQYANCYRWVGDVRCSYEIFTNAVFYGSSIPDAVRPGRWVDYDTLGWYSLSRPSLNALRSFMGMNAILSGPLMLPAFLDPRGYPDYYRVLTNCEVIAVDQDAAGLPGRCVRTNGLVTLWAKPLGGPVTATKAVAVMNRNASAAEPFTFSWNEIGLPAGMAEVRNLWNGETGCWTNSLTVMVAAGDVALFKLSSLSPTLSVLPAPGTVTIAWRTNDAAYVLESTVDLAGSQWVAVDAVPEVQGGTNSVLIREPGPSAFFRLRRGN